MHSNVELRSPDQADADPRPRVFYFAVGNLRTVSSGLDRVTRVHWTEIAASGFDVEGFVVDPDAKAMEVDRAADGAVRRIFPSLAAAAPTVSKAWLKLRSLLLPQSLLKALSLRSAQVAGQARTAAAERRPSIVVVDHIYAVQNVPLGWLLFKPFKLVFVAHDHTPLLMGDLYRDSPGLLGRIAFLADYLKAGLIERLVMAAADRIIFLSDHDQHLYPRHLAKSVALLPFEETSTATGSAPSPARPHLTYPYVAFVGSPNFLPNQLAIEWICKSLSPELWNVAPEVRILLIGKRTDGIEGASPNVVGKGFVDDAELEQLLRDSLALLSPIEHGSGLKIKILDALSQGVPVMATRRALQGFGAFDLPFVIDTDKPREAAAFIARLANGEIDLEATRSALKAQVDAYRRRRRGRIAHVLAELAAGSDKAPERWPT